MDVSMDVLTDASLDARLTVASVDVQTPKDLIAAIEKDAQLAALYREVAVRLSSDPAHDMAHAVRVTFWTVCLCGPEVAMADAIAAGLCHDLVNVPKNDAARAGASSSSAAMARELLPQYGFAHDAVEAIADAIRDHSYSRNAMPATALGRALQDADRLDALGAIGIARLFVTGSRMGSSLYEPDDVWAAGRDLDDRRFMLDHFFTKLFALPDSLWMPAARQEAARRVQAMRAYLEEFGREIGHTAPSRSDI